MKKIFPYLLTLFFIIQIMIPASWLFKGGATPEEFVVEAREAVALKPASSPNLSRAITLIKEGNYWEGAKLLIDLYTSSSFVGKFETAISDKFPFRLPIIQFSKALERGIIKSAYIFTPDTVIPADMGREIYYDSENNQLIYPPTPFNQSTRDLIDERLLNYQLLIESHPDQDFYLYYHEILENSAFNPLNPYFSEADQNQSLEYFEANMPDGLALEKFMLANMEDHLKYYYRTDHHWTIHGILRAYEEIHAMLKKNNPDISPILEISDIVEFQDVEFLGSMARESLYPINGDAFLVEEVEFPPFEMIKSGQNIEEHPRLNYFAGDYSTIPYTNHFNEFYGKVTDLIEYTLDNGSERNLMIIGSSYRNALDPLLASHYNKTYCIDLRYFTEFSLSAFLEEHHVDDILIVGDDEVALDEIQYWYINP